MKIEARSFMPWKTSWLKYGGDVGLVRTFVFGESGVSINAIQAGPRRSLDFGRKPGELRSKDGYEVLHWFLDAFLVLCLVREEPIPVVVSLELSQEAKSGFRKGREIWAGHPSIVDIRRIAV